MLLIIYFGVEYGVVESSPLLRAEVMAIFQAPDVYLLEWGSSAELASANPEGERPAIKKWPHGLEPLKVKLYENNIIDLNLEQHSIAMRCSKHGVLALSCYILSICTGFPMVDATAGIRVYEIKQYHL